jgi:D-3-phosphoglycerate dehydrogenase
MTPVFRVALSGDFRRPDGSPTYPDFDLAPLMQAPGIEMAFLDAKSPLEAAQLEDFDALILLAHRFSAASVPRSGRLSVVARFGVGYDTVDVSACTANDIALVITPDGVRRPVAVSIMTLMLALTGKLMTKDRLTRRGADGFARRSDHMGLGLVGRTLGSIGVGNIGAEMFRLARPFADARSVAELGVELVSLDDLFTRSDVLAVNCPLTDGTTHLVNAARIAMMKKTAYFINTARGGIVDQAALTAALQNGDIAGAGLDVLEVEPPNPDDPLLQLDNVILTPHALCWTDQCFAGNGLADVRAVLDVQRGRVPVGIVNREVVGRVGFRRKLEGYAGLFRT